jgi:hypothetical protein
MKAVRYSAVLALVALSLSFSAFAKDKNEGKFTLSDSAVVGSTQLGPGDYKATWEGSGPEVQVKILQGKNVVASGSAKLVDNPSRQDAVTVSGSAGARTVDEIDFSGARKGLVFGSQATAQNQSQ